jgi:hypothetical protein
MWPSLPAKLCRKRIYDWRDGRAGTSPELRKIRGGTRLLPVLRKGNSNKLSQIVTCVPSNLVKGEAEEVFVVSVFFDLEGY